jgi:(E)-4-hydroxy-3-methylbut-2-enyl-diphosphate synthase
MIIRKKTKKIRVKDKYIGGDSPILVQSMTNTDTKDVASTLQQIKQLEDAGCELVRVGVPDMDSASALGEIVRETRLPVAADIHFDVELAKEAVRQGVHKLRINPGNLRNEDEVRELAYLCKDADIPIRIGVNAGSLDPEIHEKYGKITPEALFESAEKEIKLLEECDFNDMVISLKASSVPLCVEAYRLISAKYDYPLHIGITEAGPAGSGTIKSAAGLGILLYDGIGDTLRVSLTSHPVEEVYAAWNILKALEIRKRGAEIISCPTCARSQIDVISLAGRIEERLRSVHYPVKVAVMGCVVNGPGEAREADVGIAGGKGKGVIFREGIKVSVVSEEEMVEALMDEVEKFIKNRFSDENTDE